MRLTHPLIAFSVVAAAGTLLGFIAFSLADRDYGEQVAGLDRLLDREATVYLHGARAALLPAHAAAVAALESPAAAPVDRTAIVTWIDASGHWVYREPSAPPPITAEESADFERARLGGESYEFDKRDDLRAIDAYGFYLDRLSEPTLRDRLRFRIARTATRSGRVTLAEALFRDLVVSESGATENGWPIALLAGVRWIDLAERADRREAVRAALLRLAPTLATDRVDYFVSRVCPGDVVLEDFVARRRAFEAELRSAEPTEPGRTVLGDGYIWVTATSPTGLVVAGAPIDLPACEADDLSLSLRREREEDSPGVLTRPLRLQDHGVTLKWVEIRDPSHAAKVELATQRRSMAKGLVSLLLVLVGGACVALWIAIDRQRRLAELKVRLLANVSHELKTPITSIRIFSEMLAEDDLDETKVRQFGRLLTAESRRLTQRIEDLLDYAQEGRATRPLATEELDIVSLLRPLAETFQYRAKDHRVDFRSDLRSGGGELRPIRTNANAIERIVLNLLDNALKYRSKETPWIALKLKTTPRALQVLVKDNGIGISPKDQAHIFDEFYRADFEEYGVQGTGLGLSIARALAERVEARLLVDSRPGVGSTFVLEIPFEIGRQSESRGAVS